MMQTVTRQEACYIFEMSETAMRYHIGKIKPVDGTGMVGDPYCYSLDKLTDIIDDVNSKKRPRPVPAENAVKLDKPFYTVGFIAEHIWNVTQQTANYRLRRLGEPAHIPAAGCHPAQWSVDQMKRAVIGLRKMPVGGYGYKKTMEFPDGFCSRCGLKLIDDEAHDWYTVCQAVDDLCIGCATGDDYTTQTVASGNSLNGRFVYGRVTR
jgi:hypothetical protein